MLRSSAKQETAAEQVFAEPIGVFTDADVMVSPIEEPAETASLTTESAEIEAEPQGTMESAPATAEAAPEAETSTVETPAVEALENQSVEEELGQAETEEIAEDEHPNEASASYRVDPSAPSEFRLTSAPENEEPAPEPVPQDATAATEESEATPAVEAAGEVDQAEAPATETYEVSVAEVPEPQPTLAFTEEEMEDVEPSADTEEEEFIAPEAEEGAQAELVAQAKQGDTRQVFAPGAGLLEEEIIEEEEDDFPPIHALFDEHDLDELEEETLDHQLNSGEVGEMFQEAHLDHRIQLSFGASSETEEEEMAEEIDGDFEEPEAFAAEAEEEEVAEEEGEAAPAAPQRRRDDKKGRRQRGRRGGPARRPTAQMTDLPVISDLLKPGQEILVESAK
jgi:ribonuclease G